MFAYQIYSIGYCRGIRATREQAEIECQSHEWVLATFCDWVERFDAISE